MASEAWQSVRFEGRELPRREAQEQRRELLKEMLEQRRSVIGQGSDGWQLAPSGALGILARRRMAADLRAAALRLEPPGRVTAERPFNPRWLDIDVQV